MSCIMIGCPKQLNQVGCHESFMAVEKNRSISLALASINFKMAYSLKVIIIFIIYSFRTLARSLEMLKIYIWFWFQKGNYPNHRMLFLTSLVVEDVERDVEIRIPTEFGKGIWDVEFGSCARITYVFPLIYFLPLN